MHADVNYIFNSIDFKGIGIGNICAVERIIKLESPFFTVFCVFTKDILKKSVFVFSIILCEKCNI